MWSCSSSSMSVCFVDFLPAFCLSFSNWYIFTKYNSTFSLPLICNVFFYPKDRQAKWKTNRLLIDRDATRMRAEGVRRSTWIPIADDVLSISLFGITDAFEDRILVESTWPALFSIKDWREQIWRNFLIKKFFLLDELQCLWNES